MMVETLIMINKTLNLEDYHQSRSISIAKQEEIKYTASTPPMHAQESKSRSNSVVKQEELKFFSSTQIQHEDKSRSHSILKIHEDNLMLVSLPSQQGKSRSGSIHEKEINLLQTPPKDEIVDQNRKSSQPKENDLVETESNVNQKQIGQQEKINDTNNNSEQKNDDEIKIILLTPQNQIIEEIKIDTKVNDKKNSDQKNSDQKNDSKNLQNYFDDDMNSSDQKSRQDEKVNMNIPYESKSKSLQNTNQDKRFLNVAKPNEVQHSLPEIVSPSQAFEMRPSEQPSFQQPLSDMPSEGTEEDEEFKNSGELQMAQEHLEDEKFQEQRSKGVQGQQK